MPRKKTYDREAALLAAMDLFWERGFSATSISDLVEVMGVSRKSLYSEFGSKNDLFHASLVLYVQRIGMRILNKLKTDEPGLQTITDYFRSTRFHKGFRGCLLVNSAAESENLDKEALKVVRGFFRNQERLFCANLEAAKKNGDLPRRSDPQALARYLVCCDQGIALMGKIHHQQKIADDVVEGILKTLRSS